MHIIPLENNHPVWIAGALRMECVAGRVWLTRTGGAGDLFLRAGEVIILAPADRVLAEGLGTARIALHPQPAAWRHALAGMAGVLSSWHERVRTVRFTRRRTPLAG